ncbi:MAG: adenylate/guanylate cyclase domain-containing protein [Nitrospira sp.]|nr:adenylate/guanylate cyclase domain-containing protein [Nitrospira sp.]
MKFHRLTIFLIIAIAASVLTILFYLQKIDFFTSLDLKLKDAGFRTRGEVKPDSRIVIVAIDAKSINELGRWPWDRKVIARLIENLKSYGAKTVALDIVFSEPSNPDSDTALSDAIQKSGNVIAGYFFRSEEESQQSASLELLEPSRIKIIRMRGNVTQVPVVTYPYVETNIPPISKASINSGFFNIIPDKDGIMRTSNLAMLYGGEMYPSLPLSALRHYLGNEIILDVASYGVDGLLLRDRRIPVDESGRLTLNYYGKQGTFQTISATDVINNRLHHDALKDTLAFIGATEIGISDVRATPVDPVLPGVEIHATVASNVLQNRFIIRNGWVISLEIAFVILFPILLSIILSLIHRTFVALISYVGVLVIYFSINYFQFAHYFLNTGIIFPVISIGMTYLVSEAYRNLIEEKQSRFLKKAFTSYVSHDLVSEIMKNPDALKLGGERREITILFSDVRDFTSISERLSPENLVLLLNQYLSPMTQIVLKHRGTLDKYIGDAIMALYNAPLKIANHSVLACKTALEMVEKLKELNTNFKQKGLIEIDIGIGINTGDVIVGNMGTDVRFDYTAIGDTVNLASRIEGLNKIYKTNIIISEFTVKHLNAFSVQHSAPGLLQFRKLDLIKVKGKDKPLIIYELSQGIDVEIIKKFEEALSLYRKQQFKDAKEIFQSLIKDYSDEPSSVFADRCTEYIDNPPDPQWDGVYIAKTK